MKKRNALLLGLAVFGGVLGAAVGLASGGETARAEAYYHGEEDTFRVWVNRQTHYLSGFEWGITVEGIVETPVAPGDYIKLYDETIVSDGTELIFFDLPMSVVGKTITLAPYEWKDDGTGTDTWHWDTSAYAHGVHISFEYASGDNAKVYYINHDETTDVWSVSQGIANAKGVQHGLSSTVIWNAFNAYYTCSENKDNGYGNFGEVAKTWIVNEGTWHGPSNLGTINLDDYASPDDYLAGNKTVQTTVWDKYSTMLANYEAMATPSSAFLGMTGGNFEAAVVALSGLAVVGLGGGALYLAKRRKKA